MPLIDTDCGPKRFYSLEERREILSRVPASDWREFLGALVAVSCERARIVSSGDKREEVALEASKLDDDYFIVERPE